MARMRSAGRFGWASTGRRRRRRMAAIATLVGLVLSALPVSPAGAFLGLDSLFGGGGNGGLLGLGNPALTVEFTTASSSHTEDGGAASVVLERTGNYGLFGTKSTLRVHAVGGSASGDSDYQPVDVEVVFTGQQRFATVDISLVADERYERDETIVLAVEGDKKTAVGAQGSTTLTISNDDDPPVLSVETREPAVEGGSLEAFVTLEGATDVAAKVAYATADGDGVAWDDYVPTSGTLTFPPGTVERKIAVPTVGDDIHESDESFLINLSDPVDATIGTATAVAGITDDDIALLLSISDTSASEGDAMQFTVVLSAPSTQQVVVDYSTMDGSAVAPEDYASRTGTLTIDPGQTTATFDVPTVSDDLPEDEERFTAHLWHPQGASIGDGTAIGVIFDDEPMPVVSIGHASTVVEGGLAASFPVTLSQPSGAPVKVRVTPQTSTAAVGADLPGGAFEVSFTPGAVKVDAVVAITDDTEREDVETFRAVLSHPSNATLGGSVALGTIRDNDQCAQLTPGDRAEILNRWLSRLDPSGDSDGDGFTNYQELGVLAFDPVADPARFNPLIADTPKVAVETIGDLSVALEDTLSKEIQNGQLKIKESELAKLDRQQDVHSVTEGHEVGVSGQFEGGREQGHWTLKGTVGVDYKYSKSTTDEQTSETARAERELRRQEISRITTEGHTIGGGSIAVTVRLTNTGHVAFRVESAPMILRYRDDAGALLAFGAMQPNFAFGQGPTLAAGQSKDILYTIDGIGATDTLALLTDASNLELGLADDLELAEIGVAAIHVGAGNFAQYQDTVGQNTAALDLDLGAEGPGTERYLVSTTTFRDPHGRPLGLSLCDAIQVLLQRGVEETDLTDEDGIGIDVYDDSDTSDDPETPEDEREPIGTVDTTLTGVETAGPQPTLVTTKGLRQHWITAVHTGSVGGEAVYEPRDVLLRARQAAQLIYYEDVDGDRLELRDERIAGTSDLTPHSDANPTEEDPDDVGDGMTDREEVVDGWIVKYKDRAGRDVEYPVRSDPLTTDGENDGAGDGLDDAEEKALQTDPWLADTDRDGIPDGEDGASSPSGLTGSYFDAFAKLTNDQPTLVRTEAPIDFDWGTTSPSSALPVDRFAVRWTGELVVPEGGAKAFRVATGDRYRLVLDGQTISCDVANGQICGAQVVTVNLQARVPVPITLEYWDESGPASVRLEHFDGAWGTAVPGAWLLPDLTRPDRPATGLSASHWYVPGERTAAAGTLALKIHDPVGPNHVYADTDSPLDDIVPYDDFLSRWEGFLVVPDDAAEGQYFFGGEHNDGMRVWLGAVSDDDDPIYDGWDTTAGSPTFNTAAPIQLTRGQRLAIRVDHFDAGGDSRVHLYLHGPGGHPTVVPSTWFQPLDAFTPFKRTLTAGAAWVSNESSAWTGRLEVHGKNMDSCVIKTIAEGTGAVCPIPKEAFDIVVSGYYATEGTHINDHHYDLPVEKCFTFHGPIGDRKFSQDGSCPAAGP